MNRVPEVEFKALAIGPQLRAFLAWEESAQMPSLHNEILYERFSEWFIQYSMANNVRDFSQFVDLAEELVAMKCYQAAIKFVSLYPDYTNQLDFRLMLCLGIANMGIEDYESAEYYFFRAHELIPEELAPAINLIQIYLKQQEYKKAYEWCLSSLRLEANHGRIWELTAQTCHRLYGTTYLDRLESLVKEQHSWLGACLLSELLHQGDADMRLDALNKFYDQGERSLSFLIELTATLGACGLYDRLLAVIWQAKSLYKSKEIPWQIHLHEVQALVAGSRFKQALECIEELKSSAELSKSAQANLEELQAECVRELSN